MVSRYNFFIKSTAHGCATCLFFLSVWLLILLAFQLKSPVFSQSCGNLVTSQHPAQDACERFHHTCFSCNACITLSYIIWVHCLGHENRSTHSTSDGMSNNRHPLTGSSPMAGLGCRGQSTVRPPSLTHTNVVP